MFDLIEIELTRIRRMAEQVDDGFLLYLIDLALMETNKKARSGNDKVETPIVQPPRHDPPQPGEK
jgi:hypothetical protein